MAEPERITANDVKRRLERGERLTFIDARSDEAWQKAQSQIPGSIRVPPDNVKEHLGEIPHQGIVVTYCT